MIKKDLDTISMFSLITIASTLLLLPFSLLIEGWKFTPSALSAMGVTDPMLVIKQALQAAFFFHTYQQVSYMILERVSPVTHSIGNCVKRVVVIVAAVVFFKVSLCLDPDSISFLTRLIHSQNPVSSQSAMGTAIALIGVFAYSQLKRAQILDTEAKLVTS